MPSDDSAEATPSIHKGALLSRQSLAHSRGHCHWGWCPLTLRWMVLPEATLWVTMIMARVTGAVFPGAVPVGLEGFLKGTEGQFWGLGGVGVGGGGWSWGWREPGQVKASVPQSPALSNRESYSSYNCLPGSGQT